MKLLACIVTAACAVLPAACGDNQASLQIVSPGSGSFVPTTAPLVLHMSGNGFSNVMTVVDIDDAEITGVTSTLGSDCESGCLFDLTVPISSVTPDHHTVTVEVDEELSEIAEASESLTFESPGN